MNIVLKDKNLIDKISYHLHDNLPDAKVFLFGSRAKGLSNEYSDFDIMVISSLFKDEKERLFWKGKLRKELIQLISKPVDILMFNNLEISGKSKLPGHIIGQILKEGVEI